MPRNASLNADGFRFYEWTEPGMDPVRVLSVTSIRKLAGEHFKVVNWQLGNVVRLACGIRKQVRVGPRGGVKEVYVQDGEFPGEFVRRLLEAEGGEKKLDEVRKWLRSTADEPRDVAAVRGSVVHKLIELNIALERLDDDVIRSYFEDQWSHEKRKTKVAVIDDDIHFVRNAMRQYWHMRSEVPFVVIASEPQVWNLSAGYAGSADVLVWFLPEGEDVDFWQKQAWKGAITLEVLEKVGGTVSLGDWKTSKGVYTDHVTQMHAYLAAEFVGSDGKRDERLTPILESMMQAVLFHIRPDGWTVDFVDWNQRVLYGFLGSVAFARLLAEFPEPDPLFTKSLAGNAPDTEESNYVDDDAA